MTDIAKALFILLWFSLGLPLLLALLYIWCAHGRELYPGQYADVDEATRQWFQRQVVPSGPRKGQSCCSISDGTYAEEDIRYDDKTGLGHYWARWKIGPEQIDWTQIPDEVVIRDSNRNGAPVVWSAPQRGPGGKITSVIIYCYSPGGGA